MATYAPNQLHSVPLAELQPDPMQSRKYLDPLILEELTASVGQVGIIEPIVCRQEPKTGLVYVVAGERRCAAVRKAGLVGVLLMISYLLITSARRSDFKMRATIGR